MEKGLGRLEVQNKKRTITDKEHSSGTGGGPSSRQILTTSEERGLASMGNLAVEGQPSIQEQGFTTGPSQILSSPTQALTPPPASHQQDTIDFEIAIAVESVALSPPIPATPPLSTSWQPPNTNISAQASTPHHRRVPPALPVHSTPPSTRRQRLLSTPRSGVVMSSTRVALRARKRRTLTPFDRATSEFVAIEQQRLRLEEKRDRQLHEREIHRIQVDRERTQVLSSLVGIAQAWFDHYRSRDNTD